MANRVVIGPRGSAYGIWISRPGANVLTASLSDLLFSSDLSAFDLVQQGTWTASWPSGNQLEQSISQTVTFNQSFSSRPLVTFHRIIDGVNFPLGGPGGFAAGFESFAGDWSFNGVVSATGITFSGIYFRENSGLQKPIFSVRYSVHTYNA